jgi:RNA polymerase sigma factor (sigma-70 family)
MPDDIALLKDYAETQSEAAFAELVSRYLNLVYSVAFRSTGNSHAAQEISQAVFIILARKARSLSQHTALSGWLYQTARLTARNYLRTEMRRQNREQEAYMQSTLTETDPELWPQIAPLLDDAMGRLGTADRSAIVERFFENKSLRDVGVALGANEVAARMRVNRALEKLRLLFERRGVKSTAAAISENISRHSVQVAPVGLAQMITAGALAKGATASTSAAALAKATLLAMKMKTIAATAAAVVVVAGISTWLSGYFHPSAPASPSQPIDTAPIELNNAQFKQDGNKDGTFVVETDPDTLRTSNSMPSLHIKGPFADDSSATVFNATANGTYRKTDNSLSTQYYVSDKSVLYGKRIRVTFWLKTRSVYGWVGTFVIIMGMDGGRHMQHDDMSDRPIRGTTDWQQYEIVTELPKEPCIIYFGPDLYGPGELWADDFRIDLAPADEPVTDDQNWRISDESDPTFYSTAADPDVTHDGHPALCFSSTPNVTVPRGAHTRLSHDFFGPDSDKYSGHTVRMSGWIKTDQVSGRIEPFICPYAGWNNLLAKDSMYRDYQLKGTLGWTPFAVTCAVPADTEYIRTGFVFYGSGKAWIDMDSIKYEIVK